MVEIKNGRSEEELKQVTKWLTGFDGPLLKGLIEEKVIFEIFSKKLNYIQTLIL